MHPHVVHLTIAVTINFRALQVAQLSKFREGGGLGISLEGTVDVEKGVEVRPHHYIRFILSDGPVGINGRLKSGDELLEVSSVTCYIIRQFVILQ